MTKLVREFNSRKYLLLFSFEKNQKLVNVSCVAEKELLAKLSRLEQQSKVSLSDVQASSQHLYSPTVH